MTKPAEYNTVSYSVNPFKFCICEEIPLMNLNLHAILMVLNKLCPGEVFDSNSARLHFFL